MSKAFCCDNCHDLFAGAPDMIDAEGNEFCAGCASVMKASNAVASFKSNVSDKSRCHRCIHEIVCARNGDNEGKCRGYKRDPKDGGYYG